MFLHHNDFVVWRDGVKMILAKFRIIGAVQVASGEIKYIPRSEFWDTSKSVDPTIRVFCAVQFQFEGLTLDEIPGYLGVEISTNRGDEVEHFQENQEANYLEYSTRYPMVVVVKNRKMKKQIAFTTSWTREPSPTPKEFIFWFKVEKEESYVDEIDPEKDQKIAKEQLDGGNGKNGNTRRSRGRDYEEQNKRSHRPRAEQQPLHGFRGRSSAELTEEA